MLIHIITTLGGGGAEKIVLDLAKKNLEKNKPNMVISVTSINGLEEKFKQANIHYHFLNIDSRKDFISGLKKFSRLVKPHKNKVFHCHMFHALMIGLTYNLFHKSIPIVFTIHSSMVEESYRRIIYFITKPLRKYDIIFTKKSSKWYLKNNAIIPNGVFLNNFLYERPFVEKPDSKYFKLLFLGRLNKEKNPLALINIANDLLKMKAPGFKINIVGDGYLREDFEKEINKNNLSEYFHFYGFRTDVNEIIKEMDCMLITSNWEGMPISLIECGASALPILSTPVGTIPEILDESRGYIGSIERFPEIITEILSNYNEALKRGKKLQEYVKKDFDLNKVSDKTQILYNSLS